MPSIQDIIRTSFFSIRPGDPLGWVDWSVALVGFILFLTLYKIFLWIIFHSSLNKDYAHARTGAWVLSIALSLTWLFSVLEIPFGILTTPIMLGMLMLAMLVDLIYLWVTQPK